MATAKGLQYISQDKIDLKSIEQPTVSLIYCLQYGHLIVGLIILLWKANMYKCPATYRVRLTPRKFITVSMNALWLREKRPIPITLESSPRQLLDDQIHTRKPKPAPHLLSLGGGYYTPFH
jgi:hypothetical protein